MRLFLFIISLFFMHVSMAQYRHVRNEILYDSAVVTVRTFDTGKIKAYNADRHFQYDRYKEPPKSLWERFWDWFWNRVEALLGTKGGSAAFKTIFTLLAVLVLAFFIYKLTGMSKTGLFKRNTGEVSGYSVTDEDIHSINFELAIEQAVQSSNYRLAVRLLYLQSLKRLADRNLINWQLNKTNIAYVQELQGRIYQPAFNSLTLQFENTWYGDMPVAPGEFSTLHEQFKQFNRQIN